jgi:hypothetical protein
MRNKQEKKNNRKKSKKQREIRIRDLKAAEDPKGGAHSGKCAHSPVRECGYCK